MHSTNTRVILLRHGQSTYNALGLYQGSSDRPNLTDLGRQQAELTGEFLNQIKFDAIYSSPLRRAHETAKIVANYQRTLDDYVMVENDAETRREGDAEKIFSKTQKITPQIGNADPKYPETSIKIVPQLRETELPAWQGLPFQLVKEQFPEDYRIWKQTPHKFCMEIPDVGTVGSVESVGRWGDEEFGKIRKWVEEDNYVQNPQSTIHNPKYCYPASDLYDRIYQFWQETLPRHIGQTILIVCHGGTNRALISIALGISPAYYHCIEQSNCAINILNFPDGRLELGKLAAMNHTTHVGETFPHVQGGLRLLLVPVDSEETLGNIERLTHLLHNIDIDFSISSDSHNKSNIIHQILQYHPKTIQFQVLKEDFAQLWQQAIRDRNHANSDRGLTGLVIASDHVIRQFLRQVLGMNSDQLLHLRLQLHPETLSIIHYPNSDYSPTIQAINLGVWEDAEMGGRGDTGKRRRSD